MNRQIYVNLEDPDGHIWELVHMVDAPPAQA